jgi:hypothetical protein
MRTGAGARTGVGAGTGIGAGTVGAARVGFPMIVSKA